MSGTIAMYALKPIVSFPSSLEPRNVIYKLKNIYEVHQQNGDHSSSEDKFVSEIKDQEPLPELALLEARQEKILSQLAELKQQVASLCNVLKQSSRTKSSMETTNKIPVNVDIILHVNPKKTPFSIQALSKVWSDSNFRIQSHIHSSISGSVPELTIPRSDDNIQKNNINVRLIWKDVPDLQVSSQISTSCISGEVNFLRYLSRLVESHNYEKSDPLEANLIDSILDFCYVLPYQSPKEVQSTICSLSNHVTKELWFLNKSEPTIADIAAWSALKQLNLKLPPSLAKWFQNCEKTFS